MADYATLAEVKEEIQLTDAAGADSDFLERLITAASLRIDNFCARREGFVAPPATALRYYRGTGKEYLRIDECVAVTTVSVKDSATDTDYTDWTSPATNLAGDGDWIAIAGNPENPHFTPLSIERPYTGLLIDPNGSYSVFTGGRRGSVPRNRIALPTVKVLARWGFAEAVPADIKQACIMLVARWYKQLRSSMEDGTASVDFGVLMYTQKMHREIAGILLDGGYKRHGVG